MFMSFIDEALDPIRIPRFVKVRQNFPRPCVPDPAGELRTGLETGRYLDSVAPGMTVAITAGSRGITNYPLIIRTLVEAVKRRGGEPFIFPAMGSHGGATAEGQKNMLAGLGITEETMGAPVRSTMETVRLGGQRPPRLSRQLRRRGRRHHRRQPRQAAHGISRRGGERHLQNVRHRHGQAERR